MSKRRRTTAARRTTGGSRPIDKDIISVAQTVTTSVNDTVLKTVSIPSTVVGIRWNATALAITANQCMYAWAIVVVHDGNSVSTPSLSNASTFYAPEQDVLAFGFGGLNPAGSTDPGPNTNPIEGATKTMRKLRVGDELHFITIGNVASSVDIFGAVQFFTKS